MDKRAKEDIANFSILHAKKNGLIGAASSAAHPSTEGEVVHQVEIVGELAKNWNSDWTADDEAQFSLLREEA